MEMRLHGKAVPWAIPTDMLIFVFLFLTFVLSFEF